MAWNWSGVFGHREVDVRVGGCTLLALDEKGVI
jgi:hypothetical protein